MGVRHLDRQSDDPRRLRIGEDGDHHLFRHHDRVVRRLIDRRIRPSLRLHAREAQHPAALPDLRGVDGGVPLLLRRPWGGFPPHRIGGGHLRGRVLGPILRRVLQQARLQLPRLFRIGVAIRGIHHVDGVHPPVHLRPGRVSAVLPDLLGDLLHRLADRDGDRRISDP